MMKTKIPIYFFSILLLTTLIYAANFKQITKGGRIETSIPATWTELDTSMVGAYSDTVDFKLCNTDEFDNSFVLRYFVYEPTSDGDATTNLNDSAKIVYYTKSNYDGLVKLLDSITTPTFPVNTPYKYIAASDTSLFDELWVRLIYGDSIADSTTEDQTVTVKYEFNVMVK